MKKQQHAPAHVVNKISTDVQTEKPTEYTFNEERLIESLPKYARRNGKILLNHLKGINFDLSQTGELIINGEPIPGSNITDLVHHVTRNRSNTSAPAGSKQFVDLLNSTNVPKEALVKVDLFQKKLGTSFAPINIPKKKTEKIDKKTLYKQRKLPVRDRKPPVKLGTWSRY